VTRSTLFLLLSLLAPAALSACASDEASDDAADTARRDASSPDADAAEPMTYPPCIEPDAGLPSDVFCTGLYVEHDQHRHAAEALPYTPGVLLWSDGAEKHRYLYLPPDSTIDTSDMDAWRFPVGTKVWKEFHVDGTLVETRLFSKRDEKTWDSGTYIWDEAGNTATLNTSRQPVLLASGYEIPTAKDCGRCHHGGADKLLGLEAVALALPGAEGVTLESLVAARVLSDPPDHTSIELPEDETGKAGAALGFLHANCGMPCHSSRGLGHETELVMRLRADEFWPTPVAVNATDTYISCIGEQPTTASVAAKFPGAPRIAPGSHDQSLVWLLSHRRGEYQMPPLVSHKIDEEGTQQLADWIDALPH
jgi:hypothetical protein